jgi:hypothetical protein
MATIKQLSSFMALAVNGGDRVSFTYDEIDSDTGDLIDGNKKESFFVVDEGLRGEINAIRDYIREHKLQ